jgi:hypothetical protein
MVFAFSGYIDWRFKYGIPVKDMAAENRLIHCSFAADTLEIVNPFG